MLYFYVYRDITDLSEIYLTNQRLLSTEVPFLTSIGNSSQYSIFRLRHRGCVRALRYPENPILQQQKFQKDAW